MRVTSGDEHSGRLPGYGGVCHPSQTDGRCLTRGKRETNTCAAGEARSCSGWPCWPRPAAATTAATIGGDDHRPRQRTLGVPAARRRVGRRDDGRRRSRRRWTSGRRCGPSSATPIVKRIKDNKWGKSADGKTLTGPGGLHDRPDQVPGGLVGHRGPDRHDDQDRPDDRRSRAPTPTTATSARRIDVLFDYYSDKGAFKDVATARPARSTTSTKDDGYDPARTIPIVDELLDSEKVFAVWTLGSPTTLKTYDKINQRCVPQPDGA